MDYINKIPSYHLLLYIAFGVLLFVVLHIIDNYIIPLSKDKDSVVKKYWEKIQIISWLVFAGLLFIAAFRANMFITVAFGLVIFGLGWSFWRNVFSGIVIKLNNSFKIGETISTDFATGELKAIHLSQSELINPNGELVVIPNHKLSTAVLTHLYKKSNTKTYTFTVTPSKKQTSKDIYQMALTCPFISTNEKIEIERTNENDFKIKASVIDNDFLDKAQAYFE
ncbi:MAG TPA: mechanosensitive ion channel family protein [Phaeodactylibacter sp.]|nr:mechanosensitive ion channel family protein [Phaeodactylibacter sp.]